MNVSIVSRKANSLALLLSAFLPTDVSVGVVCGHVHLCVCVIICICVCMCVSVWPCVPSMSLCSHVHLCVSCACICVCACVLSSARLCAYVYIPSCASVCVKMHTLVYLLISLSPFLFLSHISALSLSLISLCSCVCGLL